MDKEKLPVYELLIDPDKGFSVNTISIVDFPAVESNFLKFNKNSTKQLFTSNDEKMELLGVAMIPDKLIDRLDENGNIYKVWFSKDTVRKIAQDFFYQGCQHSVNIQHSDTFVMAHVYQSYIVDEEKGIYPPKGIEANDGSWIVGMKLEEDAVSRELWEVIKKGILNGFSIEGYFIDQLTKNFNHQEQYNHLLTELEAELDEFISKYNIK